MRRWFVVIVAALTAAAAGAATLALSGARGAFRPGPNGVFVAACGFTHRNHDDAIVFPNQPGRSHDHTYFGNATADAASTPESLRAAGQTTCSFLGDTAAYWVPTLFAGGRAVDPIDASILYVKATLGHIEPFPAGLKVIAGDASARSPQRNEVVSWFCSPGGAGTSELPECPARSGIVLRVTFPDCWDGARLDSADHKGHMAYSSDRACPASHPVAVPQLQMVVRYPAPGAPVELASGGRLSAHADFVNAWDQQMLEKWVDVYLNRTSPSKPAGDTTPAARAVLKLRPQVGRPVALAFNPRDGALWIVSDVVGTLRDTTTVVTGVGTARQRATTSVDTSRHYLANPRAIAFSRTRNEYATASAKGGGPVLWSAGTTRSSYVDMVHQTEPALGIAAGADGERREYWVVNGRERGIDRYFFEGLRDHAGVVSRYARGSLRTLSGIPAGLAFDPSTGSLYVADTGNGRIARLEGDGALETVVDGLRQPSALAFAAGRLLVGEVGTGTVHVYTPDGRLLQRLGTGIRRGDLAGLAVADDGSIYVLDGRRRLLVRLDRAVG